MAHIGAYHASRIRAATLQTAGDSLALPSGRNAVWIVDGSARWDPVSGSECTLPATDEVYELNGPGRLQFLSATHVVQLEPGDPLGFGPKAQVYRRMVESRNVEMGVALARGLALGGQLWVDIGTGTGAMVRALQGLTSPPSWLLGVDRSAGMLAEARKHTQSDIPVWFVEAEVDANIWPTEMYDGVSALLVFHLIDHFDSLAKKLYQALKPGGLLIYAASADTNPFLRMVMQQLAGPGDFFKRGARQIEASLTAYGFAIVHHADYHDAIELEDSQTMRTLIGSIGGPASRGLRTDISPPAAIQRDFELIWAQKPRPAPSPAIHPGT